MDLNNCPDCGALFIQNPVRDVCEKCYREEEAQYDKVYRFLRNRENRAATVEATAKATDVKENLLHKWVRRGRLQVALFPNMGYPCDRCGSIIRERKLCEPCAQNIIRDLDTFEAEQLRMAEMRESERGTYLSARRKSRN